MKETDKVNTQEENSPHKRIIDIINSPLVLVLITGNFFILQLFFQSTIEAFSFNSQLRLVITGLLVFALLRFGENRKWLKILTASLLWGIGFLLILVIVHIRYFKVVPTLFSLKLLSQVDDVAGSVASLIRYDQTALFLGLSLCLALYLFRTLKPMPLKLNIVFASSVVLLFIYPWGKLGYELMVSRKQVKNDFRTSASIAIDQFGYFPYLCYHFVFIQSQLNYDNPLPNPLPLKRQIVHKPTNYNFIILQVESLDNSLLNRKSANGLPITPVINKLAAENIYFPNFFAQHLMGGSSDAEISSLTSIMPFPDVAVMTSHDLRNLPSVVKTLKKSGYSAYGFHANYGEFWNRKLAYEQLGFERFYDDKYYSEWASGWNSMDGGFFKESIPYLAEISKHPPFLVYMITITMHAPYHITLKTVYNKNIKAEKSDNQNYFYKAAYTDRALGIFLNVLKQKGILENTVVIIFGDHTSGLKNEEYDCGKSESENIPLIIIHPEGLKGKDPTYGSHVDIGPTILDLAGLPPSERMFGRSMLSWHPDRLFPIAVSNNNYVVTPMGNLPFKNYYNSIYGDVLDYSRSQFYNIPSRTEKPSNVLLNNRYIAHALGSIAERNYTNTKEAFVRSYGLGLRVMEVDFSMTRDKHWVCFHDGLEKRIGIKNISEINREDFLKKKFDGRFTLLDIEKLLDLLQQYPQAYLVTDIKGPFDKGISYIAQAVKKRDPELLKRIIPQIYGPEDLKFIRENTDFSQVIFTLYRTQMSNKAVSDFTIKNKDIIQAVTVHQAAFSPTMAAELLEHKIPIYVHTVNSADKMEQLFRIGAFGFYTDLYDSLVNRYRKPARQK